MKQTTIDALRNLMNTAPLPFTKNDIVGISYTTLRKNGLITDAFTAVDKTYTISAEAYDEITDGCSNDMCTYTYDDETDRYIVIQYKYVYRFTDKARAIAYGK